MSINKRSAILVYTEEISLNKFSSYASCYIVVSARLLFSLSTAPEHTGIGVYLFAGFILPGMFYFALMSPACNDVG